VSVLFDQPLTTLFDRLHLCRVVVVVRQRTVHIGHSEIVSVGDRLWLQSTLLDAFLNPLDGDPSPFKVWLVVFADSSCLTVGRYRTKGDRRAETR